VLAIDASPHAECPHTRQRELTELVLLSALREDSRADAADVARQGAERESAARARSLAEMSHEIRTPLTAIGGYSDLIAMGLLGPVTDRQREALARIHAAMYHLLGLASAQLERAQVEAGRVNYAMADVAVNEALAGAVALLAPQAAAKGVALTIRPSRPGLTVRADAARLRQVVLNLLGNGIKYTASGGTFS
jgi:signal transduction histidine kinase